MPIRSRSTEKDTLMANMGLPFEHYVLDSDSEVKPQATVFVFELMSKGVSEFKNMNHYCSLFVYKTIYKCLQFTPEQLVTNMRICHKYEDGSQYLNYNSL